ncbi:hypothetical protein C8R44DRAFT_799479 [Mycena epipterygia]|nr:hypothetical protein C8R44DRAFT_799479 [Mycena epipterygia]
MTRTSRSASLRSVLKDRSESKTGLNNALRKNGGGAHNWGSLENERDLEFAGIDDGQQELDGLSDDEESGLSDESNSYKSKPASSPVLERSEEELASARKVRTNAFKGEGVDLAAIARTSAAVSTSPPTIPIASDASSLTVPEPLATPQPAVAIPL